MIPPPKQLAWLTSIISTLQIGKFYGTVSAEMQAGNIVLIKCNQSIKPPEEASNGKSPPAP